MLTLGFTRLPRLPAYKCRFYSHDSSILSEAVSDIGTYLWIFGLVNKMSILSYILNISCVYSLLLSEVR